MYCLRLKTLILKKNLMLKNILKANGVKELNKAEQQSVTGGMITTCTSDSDCQIPGNPFCIYACIINFGVCVYDTRSCA